MLTNSPLYASFGVDDIPAAKAFYADTLGVRVIEIDEGMLSLQAGNGYSVLAYIRPGHVPAEHTIVNFPVDDIEATVTGSQRPASRSSATTRGRSRPTTRASPIPVRGRPGSGILPATSCQSSRNSDQPSAGRQRREQVHAVAVRVEDRGVALAPEGIPRLEMAAVAGRNQLPIGGVHLGRIRARECQPNPVPTRWRGPAGVERANGVGGVPGDRAGRPAATPPRAAPRPPPVPGRTRAGDRTRVSGPCRRRRCRQRRVERSSRHGTPSPVDRSCHLRTRCVTGESRAAMIVAYATIIL